MAVQPNLTPPPDQVTIRRALISVSDKTGLGELAEALTAAGIEIVSTGGTATALKEAGAAPIDVAEVTGFPEIMDGRVKTLHPGVHGGLLAVRDDPEHAKAMEAHGIRPIDLIVVNLYPFERATTRRGDAATAIENIDVGGPAMIRAAAKNHAYLTVVVDPDDYGELIALIKQGGVTTLDYRRSLAAKAFGRTAAYDAAISSWMANETDNPLIGFRAFGGRRKELLRYGENPHQRGGLYLSGERRPGVASARQLNGKQLSYNNINDTDAAYELVAEFDPRRTAAVAIIKHANPCGVAEGKSMEEAYLKALACDPVSAFGGVIACNRSVDAELARQIVKIFTEVVIAPEATEEAKPILAEKTNLRLLIADGMPDPRFGAQIVRSVAGGLLIQDRDTAVVDDLELKVVTKRSPDEREMEDLKFAWRVAKHVKSNAIVYAKDGATVGIGAGQMSRVDSAIIAARKAEEAAKAAGLVEPQTRGSVVASDAFFPFADGLLAAADAGATAVIQPGGSMRDQEVIDAADAAGLAMVFTGIRHFRH